MPGCYFFTPHKVFWWKVIAPKSGGCFGECLCFYGQYSALCVVYRRPFDFGIASSLQGAGWGRSMWECIWVQTGLLHATCMQICASFFCYKNCSMFHLTQLHFWPFKLLIRWWKGNIQSSCWVWFACCLWWVEKHTCSCGLLFLEAALKEWNVEGNMEERLNLGTSWLASSSLWAF